MQQQKTVPPLSELDDFTVLTDEMLGQYLHLRPEGVRTRRHNIKRGQLPANALPPALAIPDVRPRTLARDLKRWLLERAETKPIAGRRPRGTTPTLV